MWAEPGEQSAFRGREAQPVVLAVQAQIAPALRVDHQDRPQLVTETERAHGVAVARAGRPLVPCRLVQRGDMAG